MLTSAWHILVDSAIYILVGFLLAGVLQWALSGSRIIDWISAARKRSVLLATIVGVPLPLCSCSVLPTAMTLRRQGASRGATLSFLISTPETSVTSVMLTYALMGPVMTIARPIAACITALSAGLVENVFDRRRIAAATNEPGDPNDATCSHDEHDHGGIGDMPTTRTGRLRAAMRFAFVDLFDDIFGWLMVGIIAAAAIQTLLPTETLLAILGGPLQSMLLMVLIGVPLYVCAEASTPIAAILMAQGMSPGAALVLLLVGPATNIGSLGVLYRELGRRTIVVYLVMIIAVAVLLGLGLDWLIASGDITMTEAVIGERLLPDWLETGAATLFLLVGIASIVRRRWDARLAEWLDKRLPLPVSPRGLGIAVGAICLAGYFLSGLYIVRPGEVGIVRRFGAIRADAVPPGLHLAWPAPIERVDRVALERVRRLPIGFSLKTDGSTATTVNERTAWSLTGDEDIASLQAVVHWGVDVEHAEQVLRFQYGVAEQEALVRNVILGAIREVLAGKAIHRVLTRDRLAVERDIAHKARTRLSGYGTGIMIDAFYIIDAHAPEAVHAAFRDVAGALEDRATRINQARTREARMIPVARGQAVERRAEAEGMAARTLGFARGAAERFTRVLDAYVESPRIMRLRMEFEALGKVLPRLKKYIRPPDAAAAEIDIWFTEPAAQPVPWEMQD